ncbi:hypothetical protein Tco_1152779 [Tanacetum coccineum]
MLFTPEVMLLMIGPIIPPTLSPLSKEVEHETKETKDKVQTTSSESTAHVQPLVVQVPILEPEVASKPNPKPSIPYPSRLNDQKLPEKKANKSITPLNENCLAVLLKKLPKKLGDPGKFLIPFDYDVDPRVLLILERPFLRTERALIDVYGEELTLRFNDEAITFKVGHTSRYSRNYYDETVHQVNVIDVACEEYAQEMLGFSKSLTSGNPTPSDPIIASSSPSSIFFEEGDFILEEIETFLRTPDELSNLDDDYNDTEGDIIYLEKLLNEDPSSNLPPRKNDDLKQVDVTMMKAFRSNEETTGNSSLRIYFLI